MDNAKLVSYALRTVAKPVADLRYSVVQYEDNLLVIRVYENQIMGYTDAQRQDVLEYLEVLKGMVTQFGYRSGLEGVKGDPPGRLITA